MIPGIPGVLADLPVPIDVVAVYRRSEYAGEVIDQAIACHAKAVWSPLNVIDVPAALRAQAAGLDVVMNSCEIGVSWGDWRRLQENPQEPPLR
ncbi:CoA-binding protein [Acrocarpospora sp. B8E8]|uniref:CoA-binding protein n=1 Tax=Acrocarpospora sp. B8E8 TaxID=3153572 RepID=UPI00325CCEFC